MCTLFTVSLASKRSCTGGGRKSTPTSAVPLTASKQSLTRPKDPPDRMTVRLTCARSNVFSFGLGEYSTRPDLILSVSNFTYQDYLEVLYKLIKNVYKVDIKMTAGAHEISCENQLENVNIEARFKDRS